MEKQPTVRVTIKKPVMGGQGLAFYDGMAVFVDKALPGETVVARIYERKRDFAFAWIVDIESPSLNRIVPQCPVYNQCGGCTYLHADYDCELEMKRSIVADTLQRTGGIHQSSIHGMGVLSGRRFYYRSHGRVRVVNGIPGFYGKASNRHVPIPGECLLLSQNLNKDIREGDFPGREGAEEIVIAEDSSGVVHTSANYNGPVIEREGEYTFKRGMKSFYQANRYLRMKLADKVIEYCEPAPGSFVFDLFCGVGFFTLPLSGFAERVTGIESTRESVKWARINARENRCENAGFVAADVKNVHPGRENPQLIVADPPRAGLSKKARKTVFAMDADRFVYISCNPATFARDLTDFIKAGYALRRVEIIDMFPGTAHVEIISLFSK